MKRIVVLGAGTAGTMVANRLAKSYRRDIAAGRVHLTVVDHDTGHTYQPGLLFVPFGGYTPAQLVKPRRDTLAAGIAYQHEAIHHVDADHDVVYLTSAPPLPYDVLIVATGTRLAPEETEGMTGEGWRTRVFDFYTMEGATALRGALERFQGGRVVVNITDMPIKCPVAPLEFAFLADAYFRKRGIRDKVDLVYVTPLDKAFTKETCAKALSYLLTEKRIGLVREFNTGRVDGGSGELVSWDERVERFDLLVTVPLHTGQDYVARSPGLGDSLNFVPTDPATLQAKRKPNIFALGDATDLPSSKAGSVAHFQAEVLVPNVRRFLEGRPLDPGFDGHANCFIETGAGKALLIDFNYATEPLPGSFPTRLGPLHLLRESRFNHLGKLAFRWVYWNLLLPGRDIPLVAPRMTMTGKVPLAEAEPWLRKRIRGCCPVETV
jgi:sulfide:quinone oxidoreductase